MNSFIEAIKEGRRRAKVDANRRIEAERHGLAPRTVLLGPKLAGPRTSPLAVRIAQVERAGSR